MEAEAFIVDATPLLVGPAEAIPFLDAFRKYSNPQSKHSSSIKLSFLRNRKPKFSFSSLTCPPSGEACLDFFLRVKKSTPAAEVRLRLAWAWAEDSLLALKLIFQLRAHWGMGKGAKIPFFEAVRWMLDNHPQTLIANLQHLPRFGCYKDLLEIVLNDLEGEPITAARCRVRTAQVTTAGGRRKRKNDMQIYGKQQKKQVWVSNKPRSTIEGLPLLPSGIRIRAHEMKMRTKSEIACEEKKMNNAMRAARVLAKYGQSERFRALHNAVGGIFASSLRRDLDTLQRFRKEAPIAISRDGTELDSECPTKDSWKGRPSPRLSLAAKWAPSLDLSYDRSTLLAESIARQLFPRGVSDDVDLTDAQFAYAVRDRYRREALTPLRDALELPEVYMSAQRWDEIPYGRMARLSMLNSAGALRRKKTARPRLLAYLKETKAAKAKNALRESLPMDILKAALQEAAVIGVRGVESAADLHWASMIKGMTVEGGEGGIEKNGIAICDKSEALPVEAAVSLSLLISELARPPWKGHVLTFSEAPEMYNVEGATLAERAERMKYVKWGTQLSFRGLYETILAHAQKGQLAPEDMVRKVYVFSGRSFKSACADLNVPRCPCVARERLDPFAETHVELEKRFREAGYELPEVMFWHMRALAPGELPLTENKPGVSVVSGLTKEMQRIVLKGGGVSPRDLMLRAIKAELYQSLAVVD